MGKSKINGLILKAGTGLFGIAVVAALTYCHTFTIGFPVGQKVGLSHKRFGHGHEFNIGIVQHIIDFSHFT